MPEAAVTAPAKLNLSLAVLERRPDGFHSIESLMVGVSLADSLDIRRSATPGIRLAVRFAGGLAAARAATLGRDVPTDERNLVVRAVAAVAAEAGIEPALEIDLVKQIPSGAGLGGGSSDAAAAISGVARFWNLDWPTERLAAIGSRLGSDIPWFFAGGPAIAAGRGESIEPVADLMPLAAVLAMPPAGLSTPAVYQACTPEPARVGEAHRLAQAFAAGDLPAALALMHNSLEAPARSLCPAIDRLLADIGQAGGLAPRLTGSGSCCFTLCRTLAEATSIAARLSALEDAGPPRWPAVWPVMLTAERGRGTRP
jgi:4-diphosphocytidyl-2-C-methyl-D-erythritol kinase